MKRSWLVVPWVLGVVACGNDPVEPAEVEGTWVFVYSDLEGSLQVVPITCQDVTLTFEITQAGATFTGVQVGSGQLVCSGGGSQIVNQPVEQETLVSGAISGANVTFSLGTIPMQHTGSVSGGTITGTIQVSVSGGGTVVTLTGTFTATRS